MKDQIETLRGDLAHAKKAHEQKAADLETQLQRKSDQCEELLAEAEKHKKQYLDEKKAKQLVQQNLERRELEIDAKEQEIKRLKLNLDFAQQEKSMSDRQRDKLKEMLDTIKNDKSTSPLKSELSLQKAYLGGLPPASPEKTSYDRKERLRASIDQGKFKLRVSDAGRRARSRGPDSAQKSFHDDRPSPPETPEKEHFESPNNTLKSPSLLALAGIQSRADEVNLKKPRDSSVGRSSNSGKRASNRYSNCDEEEKKTEDDSVDRTNALFAGKVQSSTESMSVLRGIEEQMTRDKQIRKNEEQQ